ncbi:hypothetical protein AB205_0090820 [Aquarana catesbeiana]|uniref:Uncharacterized protein n=1 Tax=Aquarana catesbeiana TaxID=8400 RepID=A0A2G9SC99_AQUCT|nr:hypothetical protein AB205_0090820 [Aquarana catesbeiana]
MARGMAWLTLGRRPDKISFQDQMFPQNNLNERPFFLSSSFFFLFLFFSHPLILFKVKPFYHSYRSLQQLLDYPGEDVEETFCLNFTVRISAL